jgi:hypothetical protein
VYANGDVSVCEIHKPIGNLRRQSFPEIWHSEEARRMRESVRRKECHCTTEVFMWSSVTYQPLQLARAMLGAGVWRKPLPLLPQDRSPVTLADGPAPAPHEPAEVPPAAVPGAASH